MKSFALPLFSFVLTLAACHTHEQSDHAHDQHAHEQAAAPRPPGVGPVAHEMRLLNDALRDTVTAIGLGDVRSIPARLHAVHAAKEETEKAIESGAWKPKKNADGLAKFKELDGAFHEELESLVSAASKNDVPATAAALGSALAKCNGCHAAYRD